MVIQIIDYLILELNKNYYLLFHVDNHDPTISSPKFNKQGFPRILFQYVGICRINETAVIAGAVAGQDLIIPFIVTPNDQCTHFIQLNFIAIITLSFFRWRAMCQDESGVFSIGNMPGGSFDIVSNACCGIRKASR